MLLSAGRILTVYVMEGKINSYYKVTGGTGTWPSGGQSPPTIVAQGMLLD